MMRHSFNPILPLNEYIPDGEPHVFGDRVYLFGSHDQEGGDRYCQIGNYVGWSAPVSDPTNWSCSGEVFSPKQDPYYKEGDSEELYAPDVMQGNDGRYYLYYVINGSHGHSRVGVAVCDTPDGRYEYYGQVQNPDGTVCGEYLMGDPGVINDDGTPRLYCGWSLSMVASGAHAQGRGTTSYGPDREAGGNAARARNQAALQLPQPGDPLMNVKMAPVYQMLFHKSLEEVKDLQYPLMGANEFELEDDMITVKKGPFRIVPGQFDTPKDSSFYGHAFYEASSIRRINGIYYFIYSSENSNELCYATSQYPDRDFVYRGTIISNGDVGFHGRTPEHRTNQTANDHGSLVCIEGQWYIFHHRQTHKCTFDRQACVEPVTINADGSIDQVECTSMGFGGVIETKGELPAVVSCVLTDGAMPHITNTALDTDIPNITNDGDERYITGIRDGVTVGYKYLRFTGSTPLTLKVRCSGGQKAEGKLTAYTVGRGTVITDERQVPDKADASAAMAVSLAPAGKNWTDISTSLTVDGEEALYLVYSGEGEIDLLSLCFPDSAT